MVFEGEDKILAEDILKKPPAQFIPTEAEWNARNGLQIIRQGLAGAGSTITLYTVPLNRVLWITSSWISGNHTQVGTTAGSQLTFSQPASTTLLRLRIGRTALSVEATHLTMSNSYPMPIKVEGVVQLTSGLGSSAHGGFSGWEEAKRIT